MVLVWESQLLESATHIYWRLRQYNPGSQKRPWILLKCVGVIWEMISLRYSSFNTLVALGIYHSLLITNLHNVLCFLFICMTLCCLPMHGTTPLCFLTLTGRGEFLLKPEAEYWKTPTRFGYKLKLSALRDLFKKRGQLNKTKLWAPFQCCGYLTWKLL